MLAAGEFPQAGSDIYSEEAIVAALVIASVCHCSPQFSRMTSPPKAAAPWAYAAAKPG
jgi:hypothetical protein